MGYALNDDLTGLPLPDSELLGIAVMQAQIRDFYLTPQEERARTMWVPYEHVCPGCGKLIPRTHDKCREK